MYTQPPVHYNKSHKFRDDSKSVLTTADINNCNPMNSKRPVEDQQNITRQLLPSNVNEFLNKTTVSMKLLKQWTRSNKRIINHFSFFSKKAKNNLCTSVEFKIV